MSKVSVVLGCLLIVGCNGDDNDLSSKIYQLNSTSVSGKVTNDAIYNAKVWLDCNKNFEHDDVEHWAFTNETSSFTIDNVQKQEKLTCPLVALLDENTTDVNTGYRFENSILLSSIENKKMLTPLTTFVHTLV